MKAIIVILMFCCLPNAFGAGDALDSIAQCSGKMLTSENLLSLVPAGKTEQTIQNLNQYNMVRSCHKLSGCGDWAFSNERLNVAIYKYDGNSRLYKGVTRYLNPSDWKAIVGLDAAGVNLVVENTGFPSANFSGPVKNDADLQYLYTHDFLLTFTSDKSDQMILGKDVYFTNISLGGLAGGVYENNCVYFSASKNEIPQPNGQYVEHLAVLTSN